MSSQLYLWVLSDNEGLAHVYVTDDFWKLISRYVYIYHSDVTDVCVNLEYNGYDIWDLTINGKLYKMTKNGLDYMVHR